MPDNKTVSVTIAALYRFVTLEDPAALRAELQAAFPESAPPEHALRGTLLIAHEGINGTLAAAPPVIDRLLELLAARTGLDRSTVKFSFAAEPPFRRLKFKVKSEILAFRRAVVDPTRAGTYVAPRDWNTLIEDPEVLLLDTRNTYETEAGTFRNAVDPRLDTFSDFATYARQNLDPATHRKVAMFCTGGIRCEKASAFLLQQGFTQVFHLEGGILRYLEEIPEDQSAWTGDCFVFDRRRGVSHKDLRPTDTR